MSELVQLLLPDGQQIWARVERQYLTEPYEFPYSSPWDYGPVPAWPPPPPAGSPPPTSPAPAPDHRPAEPAPPPAPPQPWPPPDEDDTPTRPASGPSTAGRRRHDPPAEPPVPAGPPASGGPQSGRRPDFGSPGYGSPGYGSPGYGSPGYGRSGSAAGLPGYAGGVFVAEGFTELLEAVAANIRDGLRAVRPDETKVEFGIELSAKSGKVFSVLAEAGGKTSIRVTLSWKGAGGGSPG